MAASFDLIVLGAGSGGYACALRAAQLGLHGRAGGERTRSVVPACTAAAFPPRRCCTPLKWRTRCATEASSASMRRSTRSTSPGVVSYADSVVGRIYRGVSGLISASTDHRCSRCRSADPE